MSRETVLQLLKAGGDQPLSGQKIADQLGLSRAAVWKAIKGLQEMGYDITAKPKEGYVLHGGGGFQKAEIVSQLQGQTLGSRVIFLEEVDSTNNYAKDLSKSGAAEGTLVVAGRQTGGKGRMNRTFFSPAEDGLYFSMILHPDMMYQDMNLFTLCIAMAVCQGIETLCGKRPKIKWPNDIYFGEQKVCGILSECMLEAETGKMSYLVCGIGINVTNELFPEELAATSILNETGQRVNRAQLLSQICLEVERWYQDHGLRQSARKIVSSYKKDMIFLGEQVSFIQNHRPCRGQVIDIDEHGGLVVRYPGGEKAAIYSGEIHLRRAT